MSIEDRYGICRECENAEWDYCAFGGYQRRFVDDCRVQSEPDDDGNCEYFIRYEDET